MALQLAHGGCRANSDLGSLEPVGPSSVEKDGKPICRMLAKEDIARIISDFARAAGLAKQAGFDAVQIHAAQGGQNPFVSKTNQYPCLLRLNLFLT
jgi:2,4-dienoyl-CoA reductase-like NADH-dependent reductase (Old Yellow Enzyme family)